MPLKFNDICLLLQDLETVERRDVPLLRRVHQQVTRSVIDNWFKKHRATIDAPAANGVAILSTLFPEKRSDRIYGLQDTRLCNLFSRSLFLGAVDVKRLHNYRLPGYGDLGDCIEMIMKVHDDSRQGHQSVLVDEVDTTLEELAATCRFSSPEVRNRSSNPSFEKHFVQLLRRMKSLELKWLARLMLKDFSLVILDYDYVAQAYHFLLPGLLRFQDSFESAVGMLKGPLARYHARPDVISQGVFKQQVATLVRPRIGIKLGRPTFHKARSVEHCLKMTGTEVWSAERKYDGEYCEIHVDLLDVQQPFKIFSKSGRISTSDRSKLLPVLNECLRIGTQQCTFTRQCILLGEMVVYCDETCEILPFHKIRKHVSRSGSFLGTDCDSQPHANEHLMIIFFDVLMIDDDVTLVRPHRERRRALNRIVRKIPGRAMTSEWRTIDFSRVEATKILLHHLTASIVQRHEGLVLKPADAPYFSLLDDELGSWHSGFIKLKKDYMQALGEDRDVADLVIVGTSYDARQAQRVKIQNAKATVFHVACLTNVDAVRFGRKPLFRVVGSIGSDACIPRSELEALNHIVRLHSEPFAQQAPCAAALKHFEMALPHRSFKIDNILNVPVVVEVLGSGYEKPSNSAFFMLRHPRILKIHLDRTWRDAVTFDELQTMAETARDVSVEGDSKEMGRLIEKIEQKMQSKADRGELRNSLTPQSSVVTRSVASPRSPLAQYHNLGNTKSMQRSATTRPLTTSVAPYPVSKTTSAAGVVGTRRTQICSRSGMYLSPRSEHSRPVKTLGCQSHSKAASPRGRISQRDSYTRTFKHSRGDKVVPGKHFINSSETGSQTPAEISPRWNHGPVKDPDDDEVAESDTESRQFVIRMEPMRSKARTVAAKGAREQGISEADEYWDWRVVETEHPVNAAIDVVINGEIPHSLATSTGGRPFWGCSYWDTAARSFKVELHTREMPKQGEDGGCDNEA